MLVSILIAQACAGMAGTDPMACSKALEATGLQIGFTQNAQLIEKKASDLVYRKVTSITGETVWVFTGTAVKIVRDRSITYAIRRNSDGIVPSVAPTVGVGQGSVNFGWRF